MNDHTSNTNTKPSEAEARAALAWLEQWFASDRKALSAEERHTRDAMAVDQAETLEAFFTNQE